MNHSIAKQTDYAGTGLYLTDTLKDQDDWLVRIPQALLLTAPCVVDQDPTLAETLDDLLEPKDKSLHDRLLYERQQKMALRVFLARQLCIAHSETTSKWQPYIDVLPSLDWMKRNHVLFLDTDTAGTQELSPFVVLEGTSVGTSIRAKQHLLQREWERLQATKAPWVQQLTLEGWVYADALFWSRVVDLDRAGTGTRLAMIPFFDFANHSLLPTIRWQLDADNGDLVLVPTQPTSHYQPQQELCLSYGDKPNQELLFVHGFCLAHNPNPDVSTFSLQPMLNPNDGDPETQCKRRWLADLPDFQPRLTLEDLPTDPGQDNDALLTIGWSRASIAMMYLVVMDREDGLRFLPGGPDGKTQQTSSGDDLSNAMGRLSTADDNDDTSQEDQPSIVAYLQDTRLTSLDDVYEAVNLLDHALVIQLRAAMMLLDATSYHLRTMAAYDDLLDQRPVLTGLAKSMLIYRQEEKLRLEQAVQALHRLSEEWMSDPVVLAYLEQVEDE
ncbi:SET domain-containing protein [Hesseltinella vesiculosa]|uniref:SET domain-containing protein n=1 Tax=Hesseltinella vesiculosa TaxID=101127 RepID=A0A1X2GKA5_9FUNG|nr:SET domain-containing protein [Hesseltinella vesiculosa]